MFVNHRIQNCRYGVVRGRGLGAPSYLILTVVNKLTRQHDYGGRRRNGPDLLQDLKPGYVGQIDVQEHHVRIVLPDPLDSLEPREAGAVLVLILQDHAQSLLGLGVVVDKQHPDHGMLWYSGIGQRDQEGLPTKENCSGVHTTLLEIPLYQ